MTQQTSGKTKKEDTRREEVSHLFASGNTACAGCGQSLATRLVLRATGRNVIVANNTGCLEVFSSNYPYSAWEVPWIHSLFENSSAVASGIEAALRITGQLDNIQVIAQGGDGSTGDIGFGVLSGMFERGHDILYVCYDNEAYMNTGVQRSGLTPYGADTTTTPAGRASWGKAQSKKDIPNLAVAHGVPYVATASVGYPYDLDKKIKKAISIKGPKYVQIHCPCPLGWRHDTSLTIILAKAAVETGLYPLLEYVDGKLAAVKKIAKPKPVEAYLQPQRRFAHLFGKEGAAARLAEVQEIANENMEKYGLAPKPTTPPADKEEKQVKTFTPAELTSFNGSGGKPVYVAYKGKVYDVSGSALWAGGSHLAGHTAGQDMTDEMLGASHGDDLLFHFPVVGKLKKH